VTTTSNDMKGIDLRERVARLEVQLVALDRLTSERKEQVALAFASSEKAVSKAEQAQQRVNEGQNEFRGALKDQASTLASKEEVVSVTENLRRELSSIANRVVLLERVDAASSARMAGKDKSMQPVISVGLIIVTAVVAYIAAKLGVSPEAGEFP
jgi:hypothetical protein